MADDSIQQFFARYADALTARDAGTIAALYAVPSLIVYPGQSLPVAEHAQVEQFLTSSWSRHEPGTASPEVRVVETAGHSTWAEVALSYDGELRERFVFQLVGSAGEGWQIATLTPIEV